MLKSISKILMNAYRVRAIHERRSGRAIANEEDNAPDHFGERALKLRKSIETWASKRKVVRSSVQDEEDLKSENR